jgi:hypothetical protein
LILRIPYFVCRISALALAPIDRADLGLQKTLIIGRLQPYLGAAQYKWG